MKFEFINLIKFYLDNRLVASSACSLNIKESTSSKNDGFDVTVKVLSLKVFLVAVVHPFILRTSIILIKKTDRNPIRM